MSRQTAKTWNRRHRLRDLVYYWPDGRNRPPMQSRLRSSAWDTTLGPVVLLEGVPGGVPLECVRDVADVAAERASRDIEE